VSPSSANPVTVVPEIEQQIGNADNPVLGGTETYEVRYSRSKSSRGGCGCRSSSLDAELVIQVLAARHIPCIAVPRLIECDGNGPAARRPHVSGQSRDPAQDSDVRVRLRKAREGQDAASRIIRTQCRCYCAAAGAAQPEICNPGTESRIHPRTADSRFRTPADREVSSNQQDNSAHRVLVVKPACMYS
jgi:hypothetical protein